MNLCKKNRFQLLGVVLLCAAVSSPAMTLGRARGVVFLGQPLKLSVPIQLDSGEGPSVLCFEADVFYGDSRQDPNRVTVSNDHVPDTQLANVYVTSYAKVDEPVVTVYLRAGCEYKSTRRFVLLADMALDTVLPLTLSTKVQQSVLPLDTPTNNADTHNPAKKLIVVRKRRLVEPEVVPGTTASLVLTPKAMPIRRSHLKLSTIALEEEREPVLKLSNELYLGESENLHKRSEAVAFWKSLNATPQDIINADRQLQSMETDLTGLKVATEQNQQILQELSSRLEMAQSQRYANPVVYGLLGILLLCSLGLVYVFFRLRSRVMATPPWWGAEDFSEKTQVIRTEKQKTDLSPSANLSKVNAQHVLTAEQPKQVTAMVGSALTEVDIELHVDEQKRSSESMVSENNASTLQVPSSKLLSRASGHVDFAHSMTTTLRAVNTQEMLDVRQQADFFMTLGQHDEALGLLKDCVDDSVESNPLLYLDLLRILHALGRKAEFDHYRADFNQLFSGHVPDYMEFNHAGEGLEAYPAICNTICEFWPSEQAIEYIEKCLVRNIDDETEQVMDLDAFRDLLMLHGVAKRIESSSDSGLLPFLASRTSTVEPGVTYSADTEDFNLTEDIQPVSVDGINIGNLSVDLDLSAPSGNLIDFDPSVFSLPSSSSDVLKS